MHGLILVDKPSGPTSFDVVRVVRRAANERKVGHTGTLDPLASGLLVVCLGQGTKLVPFLMDSEKRYLAGVTLGTATDTDDALGEVTEEGAVPALDRDRLSSVLNGFVGSIQQVPPKFSALKKDGEPLYRKARRGEVVAPSARQVEIAALTLGQITDDGFELDVRCGKGTYVRSLARDIAQALGTCGHLRSLRRVETAGFSVEHALEFDRIEATAKEGCLSDHVIALADALPSVPKVQLTEDEEKKIRLGQSVPYPAEAKREQIGNQEFIGLLGADNQLCAMARLMGERLQPKKVFV